MPETQPERIGLELHEAHLRDAIAEAVRGVEGGLGTPFGAVLVRGRDVLAATCNEVIARCDPLAHAEILAVRQAAALLQTRNLEGCVAYTSCKPCPMCLAALSFAQVGAVYFAAAPAEAASAGMSPPPGVRAISVTFSGAGALQLTRIELPERFAPFDAWRTAKSRAQYAEQLQRDQAT